ncbi:unnamed protein product [Penicillium nalgiovense]|uniref:Fibronectin type-III domain-containing protein n=1 Tax=Penicillium nalgiovense TaxID=60175 RepID=A0A9W4HQB7_PENNA|nr:unnamed protein product [Penicillium nalgiovense]CAG7978238.1 unnamed protein product [Penicillium nalgiovense]CAG7981085.1 unnamed protein product [Penicillium nalgiovense]CAG7982360.1 unnamed protein product [Penicillium nalgiovense]CAG7984634.1 unnamed protein product [Penicillium nalgiovense]
MSLRTSSGVVRLSSWLRNDRLYTRFPFRWIALILAAIGGLIVFYLFAVPQLLKFRFRAGLSWYDLGVKGFGPDRNYISFDQESPIVEITPPGAKCDPRYTFLAPRGDSTAHPGPMILNPDGELVWTQWNGDTTQDFKVQRYKGEDYLTYWQGDTTDGYGRGSWYMLDSTYTQKYMVSPTGVYDGDLHDFQITSNDTAILMIYDPILMDLSSIGGPELGWFYDGMFQEINLETGELLFQWRVSNFYHPSDSYCPIGDSGQTRTSGYDHSHINSVDKDDQGRYLVSMRHLHTVACIDGTTGDVLWSLGGKRNNFADASDGAATDFSWQHDARWQGPNRLSLFDNAANNNDNLSAVSRGMIVDLDMEARQATLAQSFDHPHDMMAVSQGNVQVLDTGNVLVGWGHSAAFTEFSPEGDIVCNVHFGASAFFTFGRVVSYRVFKFDWVGNPLTIPDTAVTPESVFVSWNGATEVAEWRVEAWDGENLRNMNFTAVDQVPRTGFETEIPLTSKVDSFFRVRAIDSNGESLGVTELLQRLPASSEGSPHISLWALGPIVFVVLVGLLCGVYFAVHRRFRQGSSSSGPYQLVSHKDENEGDEEHDRLPL